ncbi:MAG: 50S ribosomal protein L17 [candidate division Zixibacteria bacterium RBG_16_50_21]|nr:MAG: 50S ribosomal protein L17 [candidate division Zixibacteria bacterium RBG_16_50_21]
MSQHGKKIHKLGRTASHRQAMLANMASSLFLHRMVKTTQSKAKALRPVAERLITFAKKGDLAAQREIYRTVGDREIVKKLVREIAPQFANRNGGYTRIFKLGKRRLGDGAELAAVELLIEKPKIEKKKDKKEAKKEAKQQKAAEQKA